MKPFSLLLLLMAPLGAHAATPEFFCDADLKVRFEENWVRSNKVVLEGEAGFELPWTGRETLTRGREIKEAVPELGEMPDDYSFVAFQSTNLLEPMLYIEHNLLRARKPTDSSS